MTTSRPSDAAHDRANTFPWPPVLLTAAIVFAIAMARVMPLTWPGVDDSAARVVGLGFGAAGLALIVSAIYTLHKHKTTVMPHGTTSTLVTTGPFWRFRNPIYLGEALALLSAAELSKNVWFVVAALIFVILITGLQIIPEERHLQARFGKAYDDYQSHARRWI